MKHIALALLATAAIGAASLGSASALPFSNISTALGESHVQDVRVVCDRTGRCYNRGRAYRAQQYYGAPNHRGPGYDGPHYGSYGRPMVGIGVGPVGIGVW